MCGRDLFHLWIIYHLRFVIWYPLRDTRTTAHSYGWTRIAFQICWKDESSEWMLKEKENNEQTNKKCCDNQRTIIHFNWLQQSRQLLADEFFFLILSLSLTGGGGDSLSRSYEECVSIAWKESGKRRIWRRCECIDPIRWNDLVSICIFSLVTGIFSDRNIHCISLTRIDLIALLHKQLNEWFGSRIEFDAIFIWFLKMLWIHSQNITFNMKTIYGRVFIIGMRLFALKYVTVCVYVWPAPVQAFRKLINKFLA